MENDGHDQTGSHTIVPSYPGEAQVIYYPTNPRSEVRKKKKKKKKRKKRKYKEIWS